MTESMEREAKNLVINNLEYLSEVVEAAIIDLLEEANLDCENEFIMELVDIYLAEAGKK